MRVTKKIVRPAEPPVKHGVMPILPHVVYSNREYKTCLVVSMTPKAVSSLCVRDHGVQVETVTHETFRRHYTRIAGQPADAPFTKPNEWGIQYYEQQAAKEYARWAIYLGASDEALTQLAKIITLSLKEKDDMAKKHTERKESKQAGLKSLVALKQKKTAEEGNGKTNKADKPKAVSTASVIRELLMKGGCTEAQIFDAANTKLKSLGHPALTDKHRGYPKWYHNDLKKRGEKPPEFKVTVKK